MKKIKLLLLLLPFGTISFAQNAKTVRDARVSKMNQSQVNQAKMNQSRMTFDANTVVPEKTNISVVDENGKVVRRYSGGSRVGGRGILDCVKQKCPSTFDTNVVCWECQQRIMR